MLNEVYIVRYFYDLDKDIQGYKQNPRMSFVRLSATFYSIPRRNTLSIWSVYDIRFETFQKVNLLDKALLSFRSTYY
jgi:hypothetical protein